MTLFLPFTCALLAAGYATRSYGTYHNDDPQVYTASLLLIYAAPPLLQLTNHLILTRLFHFVPYFAPIHPHRTLIIFSALTAAIELLTIAGVAYITDRTAPDKSLGIGDTLTKASLVVQLIVVAAFLLLAGVFYGSCRGGRIRNARVVRPLPVAVNVEHPAGYLPENPCMYLAQNGKTILKGPGWNDSRSKTGDDL
ncbi:hypothetical protein CHGG_00199 [Chaetomium globosum CBS 148.51]|uniref:Uncharacterized protein n=1 Tax=Chaetomium globosum (strain ATCC 6205 / CBS 148.51 / DSM 1962 / NBRC 6347 / NRRL 1970) TaxID=306901 RepID=Q2HHV5_CHAGB|nr:uncharacterized protein CHGG_00199 [Chaetomium globosum CBS 148.51]EAQ91964.1 hypothetical protein CHGG_00199 [Chaetomium globosum CBS 148.51]